MIIGVLAFMIAAGTYAQSTFFPTKVGLVQVYALKNNKGKVDGYTRHTIKNVEGSGSNMTISYVMESLDKNQKPTDPPMEVPCKVIIKDDAVILDMNEMFASMQKNPQMKDVKMEITGVPMELPGNLQSGQTLKDANMTMSMDLGMMKMKTDIKLTDGKCLAIEDVTVPAGTFKCHKITQTATTTAMKMNVVSKSVSWYAPGIGTVKNETYNDKGKLQNSMELVKMK